MTNDQHTLLVVDDIDTNRDMLSRRLRRLGYNVSTAENGRVALQALETQLIDLVLLDIMMPEMDGFEVLERMKGDEKIRHIPVIMVTALDELDSAVRCIELGAEDYLTKPFNPVVLRARVGASLQKKIWWDQEQRYLVEIEAEKKRADDLLNVILPQKVVEELKANDTVKPRRFEEVGVLICDIVGFTPYCDKNDPEDVVKHLGELTEAFEELSLSNGLEKINSIGDQFMAACGLSGEVGNPVLNCVKCGLEMARLMKNLSTGWRVRIGVHVGPVIAGVVGRRKFLYGLWGDTVNTAARTQSHAQVDSVNLSSDAWARVAEHCSGDSRGMFEVKGKGIMEFFRVDGLRE